MGGGLIQLYTKGPQNKFLTGNPTITFFKKVYRKHTNLAVEEMEQVFIGEKKFGNRLRCKIERKGDLLKDMFLKIKMKNGNGNNQEDYFTNIIKCGFAIIDYVEIEIGGQIIDRHYGEWLDIWTQLSTTSEKYDMIRNLIKDRRNKFKIWENGNDINRDYIYVPLFFWFNIDPGLALPLISLQYHELVLYLKFKKKSEIKVIIEKSVNNNEYNLLPVLANNNNQPISYSQGEGIWNSQVENDANNYQSFLLNPSVNNAEIATKNNKWYIKNFTGEIEDVILVCSYIFLDNEERRKFAKFSHEYLITQIQRSNKIDLPTLSSISPENNSQVKLEFNHPVKEIIWTAQSKILENTLIYKNMDFSNTLSHILLQVNGIDRIPKSDAYYFNRIIPYKKHTCGGLIPSDNSHYYTGGIHCYSFALNPEKYQPSGSLNFSNTKGFTINFDYKKTNNSSSTVNEDFIFTCYGLTYNVLRIENGMGGLSYTN